MEAADRVGADKVKGARSLITLGDYTTLRVRGVTSDAPAMIDTILSEAQVWMLAGMKALRRLLQHSRPHDPLFPCRLARPCWFPVSFLFHFRCVRDVPSWCFILMKMTHS